MRFLTIEQMNMLLENPALNLITMLAPAFALILLLLAMQAVKERA